MERDYQNYGGGTIRYKNNTTGKMETIFLAPVEINMTQNHLAVSFKGWLEVSSFAEHSIENRTDLRFWQRSFSVTGDEFAGLKQSKPEIFALIEQSAVSFHELDGETVYKAENFTSTMVRINTLDFHISGSIESKDKKITARKEINNIEDFEAAKAEYQALVGLLLQLTWEIGKQKDEEINAFEILA